MDRWTWEQASFVAACVEDRRVEEIDLLAIPLAAAQRAKFKGYGPARRKAKLREREKARIASLPPEQAAVAKDAAVLSAFERMGIKVRTEGG